MWKEYLIDKGFKYNEVNEDFRKGAGWGITISICMLMKGLFEIRKGEEVLFSDFIDSLDQFKEIVSKHVK